MERAAFDRLLADTLPGIEEAARKYATIYQCFDEWHDISQSALLKMLRFADLYDPAKGDLLPWACVIIINTIKTQIAQSMTVPKMEEYNVHIVGRLSAQYDGDPLNDLQLAFIAANINQETQLYADGYTYAEIAKLRGFNSKATAKSRIDKCADRLCRILGLKVKQGRRARNEIVSG